MNAAAWGFLIAWLLALVAWGVAMYEWRKALRGWRVSQDGWRDSNELLKEYRDHTDWLLRDIRKART